MSFRRLKHRIRNAIAPIAVASAAVMMAAAGSPAHAQSAALTMSQVIDRAEIEDMLYDYYAHIDSETVEFGRYYTPDGVFNVNGIISRGPKEIAEIYRRTYAQGPKQSYSKKRKSVDHLLVFNPRIVVNDTKATADFIYTIVNNPSLQAKPIVIEQGREHDELVKQGDRWYLTLRVVTSDSGLGGIFVAPYYKQLHSKAQ
jgi:SnoaL-like domain